MPKRDRLLHVPGDSRHFLPPRRTMEYDADMNTQPIGSRRRRWFWIGVVWLTVAVFSASQNVLVMRAEGMHHAWARLFVTLLLSWLVWALATPLVLRLAHQYPPVRLTQLSTWFIHIAACAAITVLSSVWETWLQELMNPLALDAGPPPFISLWRDTLYGELFQSVCLYTALVAISYILDSRERLVRQQIETAHLNEQFSQAQLDVLKRQIEPHFLFNALNAIAGLVRENRNASALTMIVGLSDFLRKVVEGAGRQQVPLGDEVQFVRQYLDIQKARFPDRLQVSFDVPKELLPMQVPSLILQPIVENAVKHGIAKQARGGWLRVSASRSDGRLTLCVYNDGPALREDWEKTNSGIGISNVRARLRTMYGDGFGLSLRNQGEGVEASLSFPVRESDS
jgi:two-component system LytT family sensor kinase